MASLAETVAGSPERNNVRVGTLGSTDPDLEINLAGGVVINPGLLMGITPPAGLPLAMIRQDSTWLVLGVVGSPRNAVHAVSNVQLTTVATITNTVFSPTAGGLPTCGVAFHAPPTGNVMVHWVAELSTGTSFVLVSWGVRTGLVVGSGTAVLAPSDDRTVRHGATTVSRFGASHLLTGLTPGDPYNLSLEHRVAAAVNSSVGRREVQVVPAF